MNEKLMIGSARSRSLWVAALLVLSLFAVGAQAMKCFGTINIKAPDSWNDLYVVADGKFYQVPATSLVNGWYVFDISFAGGQYSEKFFFASADNNWDKGVGKTEYDAKVEQNAGSFTCADMASGALFISQDENTGGTYWGTTAADAKYFYFLPPDDQDWNEGRALMIVNGTDTVKMTPDDDHAGRCGWYKVTYFNDAPPSDVYFTLDIDPDNMQMGLNGVEEETATHIDLAAQFTAYGGSELFFEADGGSAGWSATDLGGGYSSCGYPMAAFIYDTDASKHGAFTCDNYTLDKDKPVSQWTSACDVAGVTYHYPAGSTSIPCIGVTKDIVLPTLDPVKKKPTFNTSSTCFESTEKFNQLFNATENVNVQRCKNMQFTRAIDGLWEYDSYNEPSKGYYPLEDDVEVTGTVYGTKRTAYGGIALGTGDLPNAATTKAGFPAGINFGATNPLTGVPYFDTYPTSAGEFDGGKHPDVYDNNGWGACPAGATTTATGGNCRIQSTKDQHFCFESHGQFRKRVGQQFYFRGDDDIWVYINNKLVVDLGGTHLAAPAYVNLDELTDLKDGYEYDIDIFFCDRRTDMSNVRIKTNMYFSQKNGLYASQDTTVEGKSEICRISGSTSSCDAILSGSGAAKEVCTGDGSDESAALAGMLSFFLTSRIQGDTLWLNEKTCTVTGSSMVCYKGITIAGGSVTVEKEKLSGLAGTYVLWAKYDDNDPTTEDPKPARIAKFTTKTDISVITTAAVLKNENLSTLVPPSGVVAGKRVPIYFASGSLTSGTFVIDWENGPGKTFTLKQVLGAFSDDATGAELKIYTTATGGSPVPVSTQFTISESALCTLWVEGNYAASADYKYSINVNGAKTAAVELTVRQPLLKFVDETYAADVHHAGTGLRNADGSVQPIMMGTEMKMYLVAYDPAAPDAICTTCNFSLTGKATITPDTLIAQPIEWVGGFGQTVGADGVATGGVVNGKAAIKVAGAEPIKDPHWASFIVQGPSPKTFSPSWDSLRFKEPPVPYPVFAGMFDRNGDGYGDSLHIAYNRPFKADSIPDSLYIVWPQNTTDTLRLNSAEVKNYAKAGDSIIVIANAGRKFSTEIVTSGEGQVRSWETYMDPDDNTVVTRGYPKTISDRMAPVVVKASYIGAEKCGGTSLADACRDKVTLQFSEPVVLDSVGAASVDSTLLYEIVLIGSQKSWQVAPEPISKNMTDTTAVLYFSRYKDSGTPVAGDSIRLRGDGGATLRLFRDVEHNFPSARQVGARIEGVKPLSIQSVVINTLDVTDPAILARLDSAPVKVYAVPVDVSIDSLAKLYPGTVGQLIKVDVAGKAYTFDPDATPQQIKLYTDSRYFSNLGSYVAKGSSAIGCDDAMFKGDCLKNPAYLYVAWNMITDDKRFVGSGAYISTLQFHWTLDGRTFDDTDVTELLGVRRGAGIVK